MRLCNAVDAIARSDLGDRYVSVVDDNRLVSQTVDDKLSMLKGRTGKGIGLAMGEYFGLCVDAASDEFRQLTEQRIRRSVSRSISDDEKSRRHELKDFSGWHSLIVGRAKRSNNNFRVRK